MFAVFVIAPMIDGAWISLFAWDGVTVGHWVGLSNYREALVDPLVREAFVTRWCWWGSTRRCRSRSGCS